MLNESITFPQVRVITEEGHLGILPTAEALLKAKEMGLDLVVVQTKSDPPLAKIVEFGKFKYEQAKEASRLKAKQKSVEVKGIRLSVRIGPHDIQTRKEKAKEFLEAGDKVKVEIILRGREKRFGDLAKSVIEGFIAELNKDVPVKVEQPILRMGGQLTSIVGKV
jgi:translation initiation factor IF-3